jgi:MSHA biogenesis protein MshJ
MKRYWTTFDAWISAREMRERVLLFAAAIIVPGVFLYSILVQPALAERKRIGQETQADHADIGKLTLQLQALIRSKGADPDAASRARLAEIEARIAEFQRQVDARATELVSPEKLAAVFEKILVTTPGIQVAAVKVLPRTTVSFDKTAGMISNPSQDAKRESVPEKPLNEIYRHGVEVTLRGSYLDLVGYLRQIESQPARMFWDKVSLTVSEYPVITMKLIVYTISLERAWLTV